MVTATTSNGLLGDFCNRLARFCDRAMKPRDEIPGSHVEGTSRVETLGGRWLVDPSAWD
jgi:hypothetical protein